MAPPIPSSPSHSLEALPAAPRPLHGDLGTASVDPPADVLPPGLPDVGQSTYVGLGRLLGRRALLAARPTALAAALALALAREGATLALTGDGSDSEALHALVDAQGGPVVSLGAVPDDAEGARRAAAAVGAVDVLVHVLSPSSGGGVLDGLRELRALVHDAAPSLAEGAVVLALLDARDHAAVDVLESALSALVVDVAEALGLRMHAVVLTERSSADSLTAIAPPLVFLASDESRAVRSGVLRLGRSRAPR